VTIQNGIVFGFTYGIRYNHCSRGITQNLRLASPQISVSLYFTSGTIIRNNQINGPGASAPATGIDIEGGNGNFVNQNVISNFGVCVFAEGGNYFFENMVSNATIGFDLSTSDKYRFNTTFNCSAPFDGGTAVNAENN
jgi:copper-binding protein NosD